MLILDRKNLFIKTKDIYFSEKPFEVTNCDAVTFIECKEKIKDTDFQCRPALSAVIDLSQDIGSIWNAIDKKSNRQRINRAYKEAITIHRNQDIEEFFDINKQFMRKKGFNPFLGLGVPTISEMKQNATLLTAKHEGEILAGHLYLQDNISFRLWLSASQRLSVTKEKASLIGKANRLLHWEAIKFAKDHDLLEYDWGGMWPDIDAERDPLKKNINLFKLSFGSKIVSRYSYCKSYSKTHKLLKKYRDIGILKNILAKIH